MAPSMPERPAVSSNRPVVESQAVAKMEARIARDRELIKTLLSQSFSSGEALVADPQLREIAERLPRLQSELRALRGETTP